MERLKALAAVLLRGLRRLARDPYLLVAASISSVVGLGIAVYQVMNPSAIEYVDAVRWDDAAVESVLRDGELVESIVEDKRGRGEIAFIRFIETDDPFARFWRELSLSVGQHDTDLADHSHAALSRLTEGVKELPITGKEKEALLFYLFQRLMRLRSVHLQMADDPMRYAYMKALGDIGYVSGEIKSPWVSLQAAREFQAVADILVKGSPTRAQIQLALSSARWGYLQAGISFPQRPARKAWQAVFTTLEDQIIADHEKLWPEARTLVDIRFALIVQFLEAGAEEEVSLAELRSICSLAGRCEEVGVRFPASWARLNMGSWLGGPVPFRPAVATELMKCMVPMAAQIVEVPGGAQETAAVMAGACDVLGPASCTQKIGELKQQLDPKQASSFQRFEKRFFKRKGGYYLPVSREESPAKRPRPIGPG